MKLTVSEGFEFLRGITALDVFKTGADSLGERRMFYRAGKVLNSGVNLLGLGPDGFPRRYAHTVSPSSIANTYLGSYWVGYYNGSGSVERISYYTALGLNVVPDGTPLGYKDFPTSLNQASVLQDYMIYFNPFGYRMHEFPLPATGTPAQGIDGVEISYATITAQNQSGVPRNFEIILTNGEKRTFGQRLPNYNPFVMTGDADCWKGYSRYPEFGTIRSVLGSNQPLEVGVEYEVINAGDYSPWGGSSTAVAGDFFVSTSSSALTTGLLVKIRVVELTLGGDVTVNTWAKYSKTFDQPSDYKKWRKLYIRAWKSGSMLRVQLGCRVDGKPLAVVTYEENIGSENIFEVHFGGMDVKTTANEDDDKLDDLMVWEFESGDVAKYDAEFGQWNFQRHIKHFAFYDGLGYYQKTTNSTPDTWYPIVDNWDRVIDGDLGTFSVATADQLGHEQLAQFKDLPDASGVDGAALKSISYYLIGVDDQGSPMELRMINGLTEESRIKPTQNNPQGTVSIMIPSDDMGADIVTNGMKFTARSI